uniref:PDZ domain-containing protein n=1 Tax=Biomphalaria glabrata TaxID=6526 RepID=A0A2C9MAM4_BIOGL
MSIKEKRVKNVIDSDDENEPGACSNISDIRRPSLAVPETLRSGGLLDESVDNLSMEVHLGGDNSRHPSEISSVSYQNLLDDGEPTNSIISRRGSDDSLDSYPPDFPDAELPPDDLETFGACDLPLSEHFPMGALQGAERKEKPRGDISNNSDISSNISHPNVKLKDMSSEVVEDIVRLREKNAQHKSELREDADDNSTKRNSLEIRNNIPVVGEVKDYEKELNLEFNKSLSPKPIVLGLKHSPGLARRVDLDNHGDKEVSNLEEDKHSESYLSLQMSQKLKNRNFGNNKARENIIEVITPIPKNMNIENEYDYVKYARVQQGNSYVGMRLAYSSSNDSLNIKHSFSSDNSSREPSPEKSLHQKIHTDIGSQEKVSEETLTEIPLNNSDFLDDKKAFTLSPENTECDSVEVESVTSEGGNSTPGFPTVEDGLSSSQASDTEENACGLDNDRSPSKILKSKQKAALEQELKDDEEGQPKEMDAQAIMDDLKMKREALDMAIADIKSAIQRSKNMSLETPSYSAHQEQDEVQPVWVKRDNKEGQSQLLRRQEEMRRVREEIERQQEQIAPVQGKPLQEKVVTEKQDVVAVLDDLFKTVQSWQEEGPFSDSCSTPTYLSEGDEQNEKHALDFLETADCSSSTGIEAFTLSSVPQLEQVNCSTTALQMELDAFCASTSVEKVPVEMPSDQTLIVSECEDFVLDSETYSNVLSFQQDEKNPSVDIEDVVQNQLPANSNGFVCDGISFKHVVASSSHLNSNAGINESNGISLTMGNFASQTTLSTLQEKNSHSYVIPSTEALVPNDIKQEDTGFHVNSSFIGSNDINTDLQVDKDEYEDKDEHIRPDGPARGYDSDDECEDADGIRYTRRNKGKKYAPLQKDDSLEMGGAYGGGKKDAAKANRQMIPINHGAHAGSNGTLNNHNQGNSPGEHHIHNVDGPLSSEESSDIESNINSYTRPPNADSDTDEETDRLLQKQYQERDKNVEIPELNDPSTTRRPEADRRHSKAKEAAIRDPDRPEVLIEGVLFRARYLGSTQLISEGQPSKAMRMMQAQEAVGRIKASTLGVLHFGERFQAPEGEHQPSTDVDLFVSTEKIMVLNTDLQEIMMDHSLRTISYIADIGDILVIMARRRLITSPDDVLGRRRRQAKILCHVFESDEAQLIAQSIGQAFQVAYLEFLKANGIEDPGLLKEMDYQDVLNQQEIYGEELNLFANKDFHKEVIVPKAKNEPLGVVIVESGWGSMVPTVVLANMLPTGPAARCGQLNIGDQIISINGISLVGLPLSSCQTYIKASRSQTVVKLTVVPCPPVVEVLIKRPDVKYQLGFSVQNGVICSLLRGGIAERGGVRVGHRIIEINNQSVVAVPHEKIVTLLASSVGEIHMKTMPTSIFRLLTGQDVPHYL